MVPNRVGAEKVGGVLEKLAKTLEEHKSYRVRLQAAVVLARKRDQGALPILVKCLENDSHYLVRGLCATGLGALGNIGAKKALSAGRKDKSSFVRKRSVKALQTLYAMHVPDEEPDWNVPPPRKARYIILLGSMASKSGEIDKAYRRIMQKAFWKRLGKHDRITMGLNKYKAPARFLKKHKLKPYVLDASLTKLKASNRRKGPSYRKTVKAVIKVSLAVYPNMSIVMMTTGTATAIREHRGRLNKNERREMYHQLKLRALRNAAQSAGDNVARFLGV